MATSTTDRIEKKSFCALPARACGALRPRRAEAARASGSSRPSRWPSRGISRPNFREWDQALGRLKAFVEDRRSKLKTDEGGSHAH